MSNSEKGIYVKIIHQPTCDEIQVGDKLIVKGMRRGVRVGMEVMESHKAYWAIAEKITGRPYHGPGEILTLWRDGSIVYQSVDSCLPIYRDGAVR